MTIGAQLSALRLPARSIPTTWQEMTPIGVLLGTTHLIEATLPLCTGPVGDENAAILVLPRRSLSLAPANPLLSARVAPSRRRLRGLGQWESPLSRALPAAPSPTSKIDRLNRLPQRYGQGLVATGVLGLTP